MSRFLLDSDVIIWFLRGKRETRELLRELQKYGVPGCSPISIVEIQLGVKEGEEEKTNAFLESLELYALDREIANKAGEHIREYRKTGMTLNPPDAIIAATCLVNDLILVTYNPRHYPLPELKIWPIG